MLVLAHNRWFTRRNLLLTLLAFQLVCLLNWVRIWPQIPTNVELAFVIPDTEEKSWGIVRRSFEEHYPNIHIRLISHSTITDTTSERAAIYNSDFSSNIPQYDLVYIDSSWTAQFADHLLDLKTLMNSDDISPTMFLDEFIDSEIQSGEYQGGLYRIPMRADMGVLFYRKDLLNQIGATLPSTLSELKQVVQSLRDTASVGYVWQGSRYEGLVTNFVEVLDAVGGTWIEPVTNEPMLDASKTIEAANILRQLIQTQISPSNVRKYTEKDTLDEFLKGKTIFFRGWPSFYQDIAQHHQNITQHQDEQTMTPGVLGNYIGIALPFSFGYGSGTGCRGGWGFGISKNTAHPKEAWQAIRYFTSAEAQKQFVLASGYLPSRVDLFSDADIVAKYPYMPQMLNYLETETFSVFRPTVEQYTEVSEILQQALSKILWDEESADEAMKIAQKETSDLLRFHASQ